MPERHDSSDPTVPALYGEHTDKGDGVFGRGKHGGRGVVGVSDTRTGVEGNSTDGAGVWGTSTNGIGVYGKGGRLAGLFEGATEVHGNFGVTEDVRVGGRLLIDPDTKDELDVRKKIKDLEDIIDLLKKKVGLP